MEIGRLIVFSRQRSLNSYARMALIVPLQGLFMSTALLLLADVVIPAGSFAADRAIGSKQATFDSPEQAADALASAWRNASKPDLLKIFGPAGMKLVSSGDAVADKNAKEKLAAAYEVRHRIERVGEEAAQLIIGNEEFPFPIPMVKRHNLWHFDTAAGAEEILDRRVGRNELNAIEVCLAYVDAQRDYAAGKFRSDGLRQYAMKIASTDDKRDGLYWQAEGGEEESPFGPLIARAADEGYSSGSKEILSPYHGYYYRILTRQGEHAPGGAMDYVAEGRMARGYALIAFPASYKNSGVMTFIVNQDGIIFEKNLGPNTATIARTIAQYDPDPSWKVHVK